MYLPILSIIWKTEKKIVEKKIYSQCGLAAGHFPRKNEVVCQHTTLKKTEDLKSLHENTLYSVSLDNELVSLDYKLFTSPKSIQRLKKHLTSW